MAIFISESSHEKKLAENAPPPALRAAAVCLSFVYMRHCSIVFLLFFTSYHITETPTNTDETLEAFL